MAIWNQDPNLQGRFHPQYPDDLQVMAHDGGPRTTSVTPEVVWVAVTGQKAGAYTGVVLNVPQNLQTVRDGDEILFLAPAGVEFPFLVTPEYLAERGDWIIHPCSQCQMPELFDPPSELAAKAFPNLNLQPGDRMEVFTTFCPLCNAPRVIESKPA